MLKQYNPDIDGWFVYFFKRYAMKTILFLNDNSVPFQRYQNAFTVIIYTTICELLLSYLLVNIQMRHAYCRVTTRHIAHSHWDATIFTWGWKQMGTCILEIHQEIVMRYDYFFPWFHTTLWSFISLFNSFIYTYRWLKADISPWHQCKLLFVGRQKCYIHL